MQGLRQGQARLHVRRARELHARTLALQEGEGVARHPTIGHHDSGLRWRGVNRFLGRPRAARAAEGG
jgi:hypothetical protein